MGLRWASILCGERTIKSHHKVYVNTTKTLPADSAQVNLIMLSSGSTIRVRMVVGIIGNHQIYAHSITPRRQNYTDQVHTKIIAQVLLKRRR